LKTLIAATRKIWKGMRRKRTIDSGTQRRQLVCPGGHDKNAGGNRQLPRIRRRRRALELWRNLAFGLSSNAGAVTFGVHSIEHKPVGRMDFFAPLDLRPKLENVGWHHKLPVALPIS